MRVAVCILAAVVGVLLPSLASPQARVERNVVYGMHSGTALLLDVHHPAAPNGLGIVWVPGSGWSTEPDYGAQGLKDAEQSVVWVPPLLAAGYTVFVPNHRATPGFHYPAPIEDVRRAVRFVRHRAGTYRVDPTRLGGAGDSSGGHLIALAATSDGRGSPEDLDPVNRESARVQALVLRAVPTDLTSMPRAVATAALFGMRPPTATTPKDSTTWKRFAEASPLMQLSSDDPPALLIHGDADGDIDVQQSVTFAAALQKLGVASRLITIPGGTHGPTFTARGVPFNAPRPPKWPDYFAEMVRWFDMHLKH